MTTGSVDTTAGFTPPKWTVKVGPSVVRYRSNTATGSYDMLRESSIARMRGTCGALVIVPSNMLGLPQHLRRIDRRLRRLNEATTIHEAQDAVHDLAKRRIGL